jgi:hypothetical protein
MDDVTRHDEAPGLIGNDGVRDEVLRRHRCAFTARGPFETFGSPTRHTSFAWRLPRLATVLVNTHGGVRSMVCDHS